MPRGRDDGQAVEEVSSEAQVHGLVVTWFKDHGICKSRINYSIAYPKLQHNSCCSQYMIAIVALKLSYM